MFKRKQYISSSSLSALAWRRFRKNKLAMVFMYFLGFVMMLSLLGYLVTPDNSPFANRQLVEVAGKKPGFRVTLLKLRQNHIITAQDNWLRVMLFGKPDVYNYIPVYDYSFQDHTLLLEKYTGATPNHGEIIAYTLPDILYPVIRSSVTEDKGRFRFQLTDGTWQEADARLLTQIIEKQHVQPTTFYLGTDRFGRDMLSRLVLGSRVSLSVGFISVVISLIVGLLLGSIAGYFRGWVDQLIVWLINVVWSIPTLLLVIAITFALGKGFWQVFIAVGLTMWVEVARVVRGQILSIREKEYVEAARAMGFSHARVIFRHILPNVMSAVIVISAANFASAILIEAGLSFLGIGVQPPVPSWGMMIKEHYRYIIQATPFLAIMPGLAIMLMVLSFMTIGNALRDALDVKMG